MRILAIDQSANASAAVVLEDRDGILHHVGTDFCRPKTTGIYRLAEIRDWLNTTVNEANAQLLVRETHPMRQYGNAGVLLAVTGMLDIIAHDLHFDRNQCYAIVGPGTWKKFITGKGNLKKDTSYMIHINRALNSSPYLHTGEGFELTDDNEGDAFCLGVTAYKCRQFVTGGDHGLDVAMIKYLGTVTDKMFDYGKAPK
jgi:hypothetical protein